MLPSWQEFIQHNPSSSNYISSMTYSSNCSWCVLITNIRTPKKTCMFQVTSSHPNLHFSPHPPMMFIAIAGSRTRAVPYSLLPNPQKAVQPRGTHQIPCGSDRPWGTWKAQRPCAAAFQSTHPAPSTRSVTATLSSGLNQTRRSVRTRCLNQTKDLRLNGRIQDM